jgi:hypothetical protein
MIDLSNHHVLLSNNLLVIYDFVSMLCNFGNFGNMNSGNSNNSLIGGGSFGGLMEENGTGSNNKMMDRLGSASMSQGNSSQQAVGTGNTVKYPHRVMVAN